VFGVKLKSWAKLHRANNLRDFKNFKNFRPQREIFREREREGETKLVNKKFELVSWFLKTTYLLDYHKLAQVVSQCDHLHFHRI
jgi:hypothetical protein